MPPIEPPTESIGGRGLSTVHCLLSTAAFGSQLCKRGIPSWGTAGQESSEGSMDDSKVGLSERGS